MQVEDDSISSGEVSVRVDYLTVADNKINSDSLESNLQANLYNMLSYVILFAVICKKVDHLTEQPSQGSRSLSV